MGVKERDLGREVDDAMLLVSDMEIEEIEWFAGLDDLADTNRNASDTHKVQIVTIQTTHTESKRLIDFSCVTLKSYT